jgi:hypothetical protein
MVNVSSQLSYRLVMLSRRYKKKVRKRKRKHKKESRKKERERKQKKKERDRRGNVDTVILYEQVHKTNLEDF